MPRPQRLLSGRPAFQVGFTLIELIIAIVIVGILAALALPSLLDAIRKSRRSEAFNAMANIQQAQERRRGNSPSYTITLADLGAAAVTASGYYDVSLAVPSADADALNTGYIVTAIGKDSTSQAKDAQCRKLSVRMLQGNLSYAGCGACASFAYAASDPCWSQ